MRKWSKCWRQVVNKILARLLSFSNWYARVSDKNLIKPGRRLVLTRDAVKDRHFLTGAVLEWLVLTESTTLALLVEIESDVETNLRFTFALPYLLTVSLSLNINRRWEWLDRRAAGVLWKVSYLYGLLFSRKKNGAYWGFSEILKEHHLPCGFYWQWSWRDLHGPMTVTNTTGPMTVVLVTIPPSFGYPRKEIEMRLIPRTTIRRWKRFWKRDEVIKGYEYGVDEPPVPSPQSLRWGFGTTLYGGFFRGALTPMDAVHQYIYEVDKVRLAYRRAMMQDRAKGASAFVADATPTLS